jgi:hypothetical protein
MKPKSEFDGYIWLTGCDSLWYRIQTDQLVYAHALISIAAGCVENVHNL